MLVLAHSGIPLGTAVLLNGALRQSRSHHARKSEVKGQLQSSSKVLPAQNSISGHRASWFISLGNHIDIRLLLVGSLLPDIIDKPVGQFFFRDTFSNGRIFCHTFLFLLVITLVGLYLYKRGGKTWLLVLSFGTFTHLILDQMWLTPQTLFWPLYGFAFPKVDLSHWLGNIFNSLTTMPAVYISEIIGALMLGIFLVPLIRSGALKSLIKRGLLD